MDLRTSTTILVLTVVTVAAGCGESGRLELTGPSPQAAPQPTPFPQPPSVPAGITNIAGDYTLTVTADPACADLPPDARTTSYPLWIQLYVRPGEPAHSWFEARQLAPIFNEQFGTFLIRVVGDDLIAGLPLSQDGHPWLVREIATGTYVTVAGEMRATVADAANIAGTFNGELTRCVVSDPWGMRLSCRERPVELQACYSPEHRFTLTRR